MSDAIITVDLVGPSLVTFWRTRGHMNYDTIRSEIRGLATEDVLLAVHVAGGEAHLSTIEAAVDGLTRRDTASIAQQLRALGLATHHARASGEVTLTYDGRTLAQRVLDSRVGGPDRWDAVQRGLLQWVGQGGRTNTADFEGDVAAIAYGTPFSAEEIEQAVEFLIENGLLQAFGTWEAKGLRPQVTTQGGYALHHTGTIAEYMSSKSGSVTYDYRSSNTLGNHNIVGAIQGGKNNTQTSTLTVTPNQRAAVLTRIGELLQTLDDADLDDEELRAAVEAIRDEASSEVATENGLKDRVVEALAIAGASEIGHLVLQGLAQLLGVVTT